MHHRNRETALPPQQSLGDGIGGVRLALAELIRDLATVTAPSEQAFLDLGNGLAATVADLQRIEGDFAELSDRIDGQDAIAAVAGIEQAVAAIAGVTQGDGAAIGCLGRLTEGVDRLAKRLAVLRGVAGEVAILAMNAKIQASHLTVGASDFAVFTVEMTHLAGMAQSTIDGARTKVAGLSAAIGRARADEEAFARSSAAELAAIRERLGHGAAVLAERRRRAATAAHGVQERSRRQAAQVAEAIGYLQINDITTQRIEHIRKALDVLDDVLAEDGAAPAGDSIDKNALAAAVCRLQQAQLGRTSSDYCGQIDRLIANLSHMSADATSIVEEAKTAFSDGSGGGRSSFAGQLGADIERASRLLDGFAATQARVHGVMEAVHSGVTDIVEDLHGVTSIDADMQIMGLNATLKCGRLGSAGRALGVIAQELRSCGKRTEDNAKTVSALLTEVTATASILHRLADAGGQARLGTLRVTMAESMARLDALATLLDAALIRLEEDGGRAARTLDGLAGRVHVHHDMASALGRISDRLGKLAASGGEAFDDAGIRDRLRQMLASHYTMASERLIHQLIVEDSATESAGAPALAANIDDCFL